MSLELKLDSIQQLKSGDCVEICGIIGNTTFEVVFLSDTKPKFKFSIDYNNGWDVYTWDRTTCDINSGSINSFLEYNPNSQFALCFHFKRNQIRTLLNENLLSTTNIVFLTEDINLVKVSGDNLLKYISFSDCSFKSSRVIQPAIHNSIERKENKGNESVTVIESRQRITFKKKNSENDNYNCSESENESEDEVFRIKDFHSDFSYFNKFLQESKSKKDEEFCYRYPNECPENKYIINYFNPTESISDSEDIQKKSESQSSMTNNNTILNDEEKFNRLKHEVEEIQEHYSKFYNVNVQLDSESNSISSEENITSLTQSLSQTPTISQTKLNQPIKIPILKSASSVVNIKILNNNKSSKIPILSPNYQNGKGKTIPIIDKYKTRKIKINK